MYSARSEPGAALETGDQYAREVSLSEAGCLVGAHGTDYWTGNAVLFAPSDGSPAATAAPGAVADTWGQVVELRHITPTAGMTFGKHVAWAGASPVVAGITTADSGMLFTATPTITGGSATPTVGATDGHHFGRKVRVSGDVCIVQRSYLNAPGNPPSTWVLLRDGGAAAAVDAEWTPAQELLEADIENNSINGA